MSSIEEMFYELENMPDVPSLDPTYVDDIRTVLRQHGQRGALRRVALNEIERIRRDRGCSIPKHFDETVQNAFNAHNAKSQGYARLGQPRFFTTRRDGKDTYWILINTKLLKRPFSMHDVDDSGPPSVKL